MNALRVPSDPSCAICCHPSRTAVEALLFDLKPFDDIVDQYGAFVLSPLLCLDTPTLRAHVEHLHPSPHRDRLWVIHADARELTPNMWARGDLTDPRVIARLEARHSANNDEGMAPPGLTTSQRILLQSTYLEPTTSHDLRPMPTTNNEESPQ